MGCLRKFKLVLLAMVAVFLSNGTSFLFVVYAGHEEADSRARISQPGAVAPPSRGLD